MPDLDQIKQGEQVSARPRARAVPQTADDRGWSAGRRLPRRPAGGHHRAAKGGREALSRPRPRHLRDAPGHPLDVQLADLDRFAKEVIPAFRDTKIAAAAQ
jgi:hypothetical protein